MSPEGLQSRRELDSGGIPPLLHTSLLSLVDVSPETPNDEVPVEDIPLDSSLLWLRLEPKMLLDSLTLHSLQPQLIERQLNQMMFVLRLLAMLS
jgi:hypothetical protein